MTGSPGKPRLAFVSPLFLFPTDAGGKIRTTNILKGMKGGAFDITLLSPGTAEDEARWSVELASTCDTFRRWTPAPAAPRWRRALGLADPLPVNVLADRVPAAVELVDRVLADGRFDLVVFDFVHAAVLKPARLASRTLCFTHNVEAEIFKRHAAQASNAALRAMWTSQHRKMERYEGDVLRRFTSVVAVSERDARFFRESYGVADPEIIPTGVDLDFFAFREREARDGRPPTVIFTGLMDWTANVDGVLWFLDEAWPSIVARMPDARFVVVGKNPVSSIVDAARRHPNVTVTGFVDDVRTYAYAADAFVIPLRVGGGTRIKAFEAMAMGCPVVSTTIGVEGLAVTPEEHYLLADDARGIADAVVALFEDAGRSRALATNARALVEAEFGHAVAARAFEAACLRALEKPAPA